MMEYRPSPQDTSRIKLGSDLLDLAETLAENAHEVWAQGRMDEGWSYGESRDDAGKKHPCLVPYKNLPESEKEYDRKVSIETLKLITALGYKIVKED